MCMVISMYEDWFELVVIFLLSDLANNRVRVRDTAGDEYVSFGFGFG